VDFAVQRGRRELTNGDLLVAAEPEGFEVTLTADANLRHQRNLTTRLIAIVVLPTNARPVIRDNPDAVVRAVDAATPQEVAFCDR
jgi:hypothetical protein